MNQTYTPKVTAGKLLFATIVAMLVGWMHPFIVLTQCMLPMPIITLAAMLPSVLFVSAGLMPALLLMVVQFVSSVVNAGWLLAMVFFFMSTLPAIVLIAGVRSRKPFFQQVKIGILVSAGGIVIAILMLALRFGRDMIGQCVAFIDEYTQRLIVELWPTYEQIFASMSGAQTPTLTEMAQQMREMLHVMQIYSENYLIANLLSGAALTVLLSAHWSNWLMARRGEATSESYVSLSGWFMPANLTWGFLIMVVCCEIMVAFKISGASATGNAVMTLAQYAFIVQGLASFDRSMKDRGGGRRAGMVSLLLFVFIFLGMLWFLALYGCASALFGRKGALRKFIDSQKDKFKDDD